MAALFDFVFELLKIALLSSLYGLGILILALLVEKITKADHLNNLLKSKFKFWKHHLRSSMFYYSYLCSPIGEIMDLVTTHICQ